MENNNFFIKNIKFTDMNFSQTKNFTDVKNIKIDFGVASGYFVDKKNNLLQLDLQLKIELFNGNNHDIAWSLEAKVSSIIEYKSKFYNDDLRQLLNILYLYSKPIIKQMACIANVPIFNLPELDFNNQNIKLINMNDKIDK